MTPSEVGEAVAAGIAAAQKPAGGSPEGDADLADLPIPVSESTASLVDFVNQHGADALSAEAQENLRTQIAEEMVANGEEEPPETE